MIKFVDKFWGKKIGRKETNFDELKIEPVIIIDRKHKDTFIIFMPNGTFSIRLLIRRFIPKSGNVIIFRFPTEILSSELIKFKKMFEEYYKKALSLVRKRKINKNNLIIIGISLGSSPAYLLANNYGCKKIITVAPVCNIPNETENSVDSKLLLKETIKKGFTKKRIREELLKISPLNNYKNINGEIEMYLGAHDYIVPSDDSQKLAKKMKKEGKKVKVKIYPHWGHVLTILSFNIKKINL